MEGKILIVAKTEVAKVFEALGIELLLVTEDNALEKLNKVKVDSYAIIIYQSSLVNNLKTLVRKYEDKPTPIFLNIPIENDDNDESLTVLRETIENTLGVKII